VPILLGIIAVLVAILVVGTGVAIVALVYGGGDEDEPESNAVASPAIHSASPVEEAGEEGYDVVADVEAKLERGEEIGDDTVRALRDQLGREPRNGRPHVLIGHVFVARAWHSDALDHYERAVLVDRPACDDPRMIANLVGLSLSTTRNARRASDLLVRTYGRDAAPEIERALREDDLDAAGRRALEQLRDRVASAH
jgi:hypothetical protein